MRNEKVCFSYIDYKFLQTCLHGIHTFLLIPPCINDQISLWALDRGGVQSSQRIPRKRNFDLVQMGSDLFNHGFAPLKSRPFRTFSPGPFLISHCLPVVFLIARMDGIPARIATVNVSQTIWYPPLTSKTQPAYAGPTIAPIVINAAMRP